MQLRQFASGERLRFFFRVVCADVFSFVLRLLDYNINYES